MKLPTDNSWWYTGLPDTTQQNDLQYSCMRSHKRDTTFVLKSLWDLWQTKWYWAHVSFQVRLFAPVNYYPTTAPHFTFNHHRCYKLWIKKRHSAPKQHKVSLISPISFSLSSGLFCLQSLSLKMFKLKWSSFTHVMKAYCVNEVELHSFLTSALGEGQWSTSRHGGFSLGNEHLHPSAAGWTEEPVLTFWRGPDCSTRSLRLCRPDSLNQSHVHFLKATIIIRERDLSTMADCLRCCDVTCPAGHIGTALFRRGLVAYRPTALI